MSPLPSRSKAFPPKHSRLSSLFCGVVLLTLSLVVLSGCDDLSRNQPASSPPEAQAARLSAVVKYGHPAEAQQATPVNDRPVSDQASLEKAKQFGNDFSRFAGHIMTASSWKKADQAARTLLEKASPVPQYYREQEAANVMLKVWLTKGPRTPARQKATAFYTDLLLKNQSPQGATIARSLKRLQGYWTDARIAQAARSTLPEAKATLQKERAKQPEKLHERMPDTFRNEQERHLYQTREALARLEAMSQSSK